MVNPPMKKTLLTFAAILSFLLISCASKPANEPLTQFEKEKNTIYSTLKNHYAGFYDMQKRGFSEKVWKEVSNYDDVRAVFDKYVVDTHFCVHNYKDFYYQQEQVFDPDSIQSADPEKTFVKKTTSNTFYLRYNSCDIKWASYAVLPDFAEEASKYDYIVLDFRSNRGGGNGEQHEFFLELLNLGYKGTIIVTQDNWCYSAGEVWIIAYPFTKVLDIKLVGTHSGGMQVYGNCVGYMVNGLYFWLPSSSFATSVPPNYLGEGKGYEPDIWANKDNMKSELEKLGLDLADIVFN